MTSRRLLFSITKKDFEVQTFRSGGKGGQHQNTTDSGVRIIHPASGARGESREHREQGRNKQAAFKRLVESREFKAWHKVECARRLGACKSPEQISAEVDDTLAQDEVSGRLKVEYYEPAR